MNAAAELLERLCTERRGELRHVAWHLLEAHVHRTKGFPGAGKAAVFKAWLKFRQAQRG